jgi:hypothetical protein
MMQKYLLAIGVGVILAGTSSFLVNTKPVSAQNERSAAVFDSSGKMQLPTGFAGGSFSDLR